MKHFFSTERARAFSLIELVIVSAIITVISAVILANNNTFSNNVLLGNLAYDVALSIRQAQVFGISTREVSPGGSNFTTAYGVSFATAAPTTYTLFADTNNSASSTDGIYNLGDATVQTFTLQGGYRISQLCLVDGLGAETCSSPSGPRWTVHITFKRPNPDARIIAVITGSGIAEYKGAKIELRAPKGKTRRVSIELTGQISISQ